MVASLAHNSINRTVHLSNIIRAQYSSGRISLPQNGGLYTRLKHVQGVPARSRDEGYPVSKLRMIDLLVERLVRLKGEKAASRPAAISAGQEADALVSEYAAELSAALKSAENTISPSITSGIVETGALFSLVA